MLTSTQRPGIVWQKKRCWELEGKEQGSQGAEEDKFKHKDERVDVRRGGDGTRL